MKRLCTCTGDGFGVAALATVGLVSALSLAPAVFAQDCLQPDANCQLPDQLGHGAGGTVGATSDANLAADFEVIDNFIAAGAAVENICWWGFYLDFSVPEDCGPGAVADVFTVTYYANVPGFPATPDLATVIGGPFVEGVDLTVTKAATGLTIPSGAGELAEYEYTGAHAPVTITPGTCYWISIQNNTDPSTCFWLWSTAASVTEDPVNGKGDGNSFQDGGGGTEDYDLAFCIDSALTPDPAAVCDLAINPGCADATNPCDTFSPLPGCEDQECCSLVCVELPFCCTNFWNQQCVDAAAVECVFVPPAPVPCPPLLEANCQLPDLGGSGGLPDFWFIGSVSDQAQTLRVADNFVAGETGDITQVCWWGFYSNSSQLPDCSATAVDDFTVTFYADNGNALPGAVLASFDATSGLVVTRLAETAHPGSQTDPDDDLLVYRYQVNLPPTPAVSVVADQCYWLEITNNLDGSCVWFWETANHLANNDFDYSLQDDGSGYDFTDAQDIELGWCLDIALGDVTTCAPANPQEVCAPPGTIVLTQNADPDTITPENSVACVATFADDTQAFSVENYFARSYNLATIPDTQTLDLEVVCVRVAVEVNDGSAYPVTVNLYHDVNGGAPTAPGVDLNLLGTTEVVIPVNTALGFVQAQFDPPVAVPADIVLVVELAQRDRDPTPAECDVDGDCDGLICVGDPNPGDGAPEGFCDTVFDGGAMWPGTNNLGSTQDCYIRSPSCTQGSNVYFSMTAINFPDAQLVQEVHVQPPGGGCIWDCQATPDGEVGVNDFLAMLAQWGGPGSCDFDGGGVGITDFLTLLGVWGPCP